MTKQKVKVLLTNIAFLNNNYGAQGIALTLMKELAKFFPADFTFVLPEIFCQSEELDFAKRWGYSVVPEPSLLSFWGAVRSIGLGSIIYPFLKLLKRRRFGTIPQKEKELYKNLLEEIKNSDVIIDVAGIEYVDFGKFGLLSTLIYHFYISFYQTMANKYGKLYLKFTKSYGPFYGRVARFLAKKSLNNLPFLFVRGEKNMAELQRLNLKIPVYAFPDVSILMEPENQEWAKGYLTSLGIDVSKPIIGLSPSSVIFGLKEEPSNICGKKHLTLCEKIIRFFQNKGVQVLLVPHSIVMMAKENCDLHLSNIIYQSIQDKYNLFILPEPLDYFKVRAIIGLLDFYITSRYHSLISALYMGVPTVILSWHIKYEDAISLFLEDFCVINSRTTSLEEALYLIERYYTNRGWFNPGRVKLSREKAKEQVKKSIEILAREISNYMRR